MPNLVWQHNTVMQLTVVASCIGSQIVNVWHFEAPQVMENTFDSDQERIDWSGAVADHWLANMKTSWLTVHNGEYAISVVKAQVLEVKNQWRHKLTSVERPLSSANTGTGTGTVENAAVCAVMKWRTPQAGKRSRGRSYIGPIPGTWMSDGQVVSANQAPFNTHGALMVSTYGASGSAIATCTLAIYSRPYNQGEYEYASRKTGRLEVVSPVDYAGNSTFVTAYAFDPVLRSQRRRTLGVGS